MAGIITNLKTERIMKKILILTAASLTLFAACSKEKDVTTAEIVPGGKVQATFIAEVDQTKATENNAEFSWTAGDAIAVVDKNDDAINYFYCTTESDASAGKFTGTHSGEYAYAITPFEVAKSMEHIGDDTNVSIDYTITLPGTYSNYVPGTTNAVMVGTPNGVDKFLFRHAAALLKFTIVNVPVNTESFWLTTNKKITGDYSFTKTSGIQIAETATTETSVALELKDKVTTPNTTLTFYVPVPTGTYTNFVIDLYDGELNSLAHKAKSGLNITLNRGDVYYTPTITLEPSAKTYTKVTSEPADWSGTYLIVFEGATVNNAAVPPVAFDGSIDDLTVANNGTPVTISGNTITGNSTIDAAVFEIAAVTGGYSIQAVGNTGYIGNASDSNSITASSEALVNTISINEDNSVNIISSGGSYLRYNASSGQYRFRYYKSSSYTGQKPIYLYLLDGSATTDTRDDVTLSFSPANPTAITLGDCFTEPILTVNPTAAASLVTYDVSSVPANCATIDATTGALIITAAGEITVTASIPQNDPDFKPASTSYTLTVNPAVVVNGSVDNPVSMADVVAAIDNLADSETTTDFYYVGGTVSVASAGIWSGKLTFSFTDGTNTVKAYNCLNLNETNFSTKDDVALGDNVVVYGNLEKYVKNNEVTYEIVNCHLAKHEAAPYFIPTLSSDSITAEGGDITLTISSNTSWTVSVTGNATLSTDSGSNDGSVTVTIPQNNDGATYTLSFTATGVTPAPSDLTITQNAYVNLVSATAIFTGKKSGGMTGTQAEQTGVRRNVTAVVSSGLADATNDHIRVYKNNTLTLSVPSGAYITAIEFTGVSGNPVSGFGTHDGLTTSGDDGSWTGNANSVTFTASGAQVRLAQISVTYSIAADALVTYPPTINVTSANPMEIANTASTQTITYIIDEAPSGAVLTGVTKSSGATWISNIVYNTSGTVSFDVAAQEEDADARTATLTLSYTGATDVPVTVNQAEGPSSGGGTDSWVLVTSVSDLSSGDEIIIANVGATYAIGPQASNNRTGKSITASNHILTEINEDVVVITLEGTSNNWMFNVGSNNYLYANSSSANQLRQTTASSAGDNGKWTISIDSSSGAATIHANGSNTRNYMRYNPNGGSPIFACYASNSTTGTLTAIYKKVTN